MIKLLLERLSYYNMCYMCGNKRNLHECNNCLELFCTACDLLINDNWCRICINGYSINIEKN